MLFLQVCMCHFVILRKTTTKKLFTFSFKSACKVTLCIYSFYKPKTRQNYCFDYNK